jgi:hypothetical protein
MGEKAAHLFQGYAGMLIYRIDADIQQDGDFAGGLVLAVSQEKYFPAHFGHTAYDLPDLLDHFRKDLVVVGGDQYTIVNCFGSAGIDFHEPGPGAEDVDTVVTGNNKKKILQVLPVADAVAFAPNAGKGPDRNFFGIHFRTDDFIGCHIDLPLEIVIDGFKCLLVALFKGVKYTIVYYQSHFFHAGLTKSLGIQ